MAIAPVNKFLSVAVPVAPGEQKLYEVPTGTSSLLLYAQVSNVGINTYPTVTLIHRRESRSTGITRDIRVIKDIEIPPNDAAILVDGRLVLEKTATTLDRLFISGVQSGITTITYVHYDEPSGIATLTTMDPHGLAVNDQVTLSGIAFTCPSGSGITTTIFPEPQASYTVDEVGVNTEFSCIVGSGKYNHGYNPAVHQFVRAKPNSISVFGSATKHTPYGAVYDGNVGIVTLTLSNHGFTAPTAVRAGAGTTFTAATGVLDVVTTTTHGFSNGDLIKLEEGAITFSCDMDSRGTNHAYPRSGDPASRKYLPISNVTSNGFRMNVGSSSNTSQHYFEEGAVNGIKKATSIIGITTESMVFTCSMDYNTSEHAYPRSTDYAGQPGQWLGVDAITNDTQYTVAAGSGDETTTYNPETGIMRLFLSGGAHGMKNGEYIKITDSSLKFSCNAGLTAHNYVGGTATNALTFNDSSQKNVTNAVYTPSTGVLVLTIGSHSYTTSNTVTIAANSLTFQCAADNYASNHTYPRTSDPVHNTAIAITAVDQSGGTITVNVGVANAGSASQKDYPRSTDPVSGRWTKIFAVTENTVSVQVLNDIPSTNITPHVFVSATSSGIRRRNGTANVYVGVSSSGGSVAPLQMEFIGSFLENSTA
tara:strand:+ start:1468 stop:3411 length:1944 start_codon:yes stop_codon:yes gene_type:complete